MRDTARSIWYKVSGAKARDERKFREQMAAFERETERERQDFLNDPPGAIRRKQAAEEARAKKNARN